MNFSLAFGNSIETFISLILFDLEIPFSFFRFTRKRKNYGSNILKSTTGTKNHSNVSLQETLFVFNNRN